MLRIAQFQTELGRKGPGLLLRDIRRDATDVRAVAALIAEAAPDVILLGGVDYDYDGAALSALAAEIAKAGHPLPHQFALRPNAGLQTGADFDGDGRRGEPEDAQGYGWFSGSRGLAILSRHPIARDAVQDFSGLLWRDQPGAEISDLPDWQSQRLSSVAHWTVPVVLPEGGRVTLLAFGAGPPVFDGPEDRNGRRNAAELLFWRHYLDGAFGPAASAPFVLLGTGNLDPLRGEGRRAAITALLDDPRLVDPWPEHPATARFGSPGPGDLRVDYILPSADWQVAARGMLWPERAGRHALLWVDLQRK